MKVLILGRANVGKSSLFNRLVGRKKSLVINEPGITRDLLKEKVNWWGHEFEVMDSGGLMEKPVLDEISFKVLEKIKQALLWADVFVVVVDGSTGRHPGDFQAVQMARETSKPFIIFVNKIDHPRQADILTADFFGLNHKLLHGSFEHNYGVDDVVEWIISQKKKTKAKEPAVPTSFKKPRVLAEPQKNSQKSAEDDSSLTDRMDFLNKPQPVLQNKPTRLFVIGRANSGKSRLCNQILKKDRMIVSSLPGTTLDTVTDFFSYNKKEYSISDNPGSRRGHRREREKISFAKSRSELEKADIVLLVASADLSPGRGEARLVQLCLDKHKTVLLVLNKMDLLKPLPVEEKKKKQEEIQKVFHFYPDLPTVFVSAKTGYNKNKLLYMIENLKKKIYFRISTHKLNDFFMKTIRKAPAPVYGTSDVKFYYVSQSSKAPPEFIAFANYPQGVTTSYRRFIINSLKKKWDLSGIPIAFRVLSRR